MCKEERRGQRSEPYRICEVPPLMDEIVSHPNIQLKDISPNRGEICLTVNVLKWGKALSPSCGTVYRIDLSRQAVSSQHS